MIVKDKGFSFISCTAMNTRIHGGVFYELQAGLGSSRLVMKAPLLFLHLLFQKESTSE